MKKQVTMEHPVPTANIAVNKSRVKLYNKEGDMPTYYLQKNQEFQIELFNPTQGNVLAKITLNGNAISQGGLILKPGQRIFLERYIDVAKKFLFDTYEVSNTKEVKEAIEKNGDFKVEFYRERTHPIFLNLPNYTKTYGGSSGGSSGGPTYTQYPPTNNPFTINCATNTTGVSNITLTNTSSSSSAINGNLTTSAFYSSTVGVHDGAATMDWMQPESDTLSMPIKSNVRSKKSIETGRVEEGSKSDQKLKTVDMDFEYFSFHTIECKMLPVSQKINTSEDINIRQYCTKCGNKYGKTDIFCSKCGDKK